jgi:glycerol-3-phosphate dehydrogenase (NAD(P)+)
MKILTLWLWAFGYAINKHLWDYNTNEEFYAYELNTVILNEILHTRSHPLFFKNTKLSPNILIIDNYLEILSDIDLLIIAIPSQCIYKEIKKNKHLFKNGIIILNFAKWIDSLNNQTISQLISDELSLIEYHYAVLSGWMIASELIKWSPLWADLWINDFRIWNNIKILFNHNNLEVKLTQNIIDIELYWSFKNILAILVWYYQWKWDEMSTIWYHFINLFNEFKEIVKLYWWNMNLNFSSYSLWWDIIATCFWKSRNRYFWQLIWKWASYIRANEILKKEYKYAEWYMALKNIYQTIENKDWYYYTKQLYKNIILDNFD